MIKLDAFYNSSLYIKFTEKTKSIALTLLNRILSVGATKPGPDMALLILFTCCLVQITFYDRRGFYCQSIAALVLVSQSVGADKIAENSQELINAIVKLKPSSSKGTYLKGVSMASSMSPGIAIDTKTVQN